MWRQGALLVFMIMCSNAQVKVCHDHKMCAACLQVSHCVFLITASGGICADKGDNIKFITKVRLPSSCYPVEGIIKPSKDNASDYQPETQPLIAAEATTNKTPTMGYLSGRPIKNSTPELVKTRGIQIQLAEAQCNFYIVLFQKLHPKSVKLDKEYGRCIRKSV